MGVGRMQAVAGTCLHKHDLDAGTKDVHDFCPDRHPGEFVFVPKLAAASRHLAAHRVRSPLYLWAHRPCRRSNPLSRQPHRSLPCRGAAL
jgi:hypothetical protein